jgi:hypothetical protein
VAKHVFTTLGPLGLYGGPQATHYPAGWWLVLSNGWTMRYEHLAWRLYKRVVLERYPLVLRNEPRATQATVRKWRRGGAL